MQHQWKNGINWAWFKSIIDGYAQKEISRKSFAEQWKNAQKTMATLNKKGSGNG